MGGGGEGEVSKNILAPKVMYSHLRTVRLFPCTYVYHVPCTLYVPIIPSVLIPVLLVLPSASDYTKLQFTTWGDHGCVRKWRRYCPEGGGGVRAGQTGPAVKSQQTGTWKRWKENPPTSTPSLTTYIINIPKHASKNCLPVYWTRPYMPYPERGGGSRHQCVGEGEDGKYSEWRENPPPCWAIFLGSLCSVVTPLTTCSSPLPSPPSHHRAERPRDMAQHGGIFPLWTEYSILHGRCIAVWILE